MATAKITLTYSTTSTSATSVTVKVTMHYYGNGVSYNDDGRGTITLNGTSKSFTHSFTTSTSSQTMGSASFTISKTHASRSLTASGKFVTGVSIGTLSASKSVSVPAKTSYTVSYNANGGSGVPTSQTKWYGETLVISSTQPTRNGYTFYKWNTKSDGTGSNYSSGDNYTTNASITLYARWTVKSYTLTANANGGSIPSTTGWTGSGNTATKSVQYSSAYGTLPTPTRNGYNFDGWWTSADGGTQISSTTKMGALNTTIYAHWSDAYTEPRLSNINAIRCDISGNENMSGNFVKLSFTWSAGKTVGQTSFADATNITVSGTFTLASHNESGEEGVIEFTTPEYLDVGKSSTTTVTLIDNNTSETYVYDIEMPVGGLPVHIRENGKAVAIFGTADENDEGLIVNGNINASGDVIANGKSLKYTPTIGSASGKSMASVNMYTDGTYAFGIQFKTDANNGDPNRQYNLYAMDYHNGYNALRLRDATNATNIWTLKEIVTDVFSFTDVSYTAGTIGTRGAQKSVNISKAGYIPIGATIGSISDSTAFIPAVFFNSSSTPTTLYANFYRTATSAKSSLSMTVIVTYISKG